MDQLDHVWFFNQEEVSVRANLSLQRLKLLRVFQTVTIFCLKLSHD